MRVEIKLITLIPLFALLTFSSLGNSAHANQPDSYRTHQKEVFHSDQEVPSDFHEPASLSSGVTTLPSISGGFVQYKSASFKMEVKNTGDQGSDLYNLFWTTENPGWKAAFHDANSMYLLSDTDGDGNPDTGPLGQGAVKAVLVIITPPKGARIGAHTTTTVSARSSNDPSKTAQSLFTAAVPTTFAQAYTDEEANIRLGLFSENSSYHSKMEGWFQGTTLTLTAFNKDHFIYSWEMSYKNKGEDESEIDYTDIEYTLIGRFGNILTSTRKLTDNENAVIETRDRFPHLSVDAGGYAGVTWIRTLHDRQEEKVLINSNVYITILNPQGERTGTLLNVTNNNQWGSNDDFNVPMFSTPRLNAVDGKLVLTWIQSKWKGAGEEKDVWYAIYNLQGQLLKAPASLTDSDAGIYIYHSPTLIPLPQNRVLVAYSLYNYSHQTNTIAYTVMNSSGVVVFPQTTINGSYGSRVDGVQLLSGNVLLAWTKGVNEGIAYTIVDTDTYELSMGPVVLYAPDERRSDFVSVTQDTNGNGVLTWLDSVYNNHLYYTLVDGSGSIITPPLSFYTTYNSSTYVLTSDSGQGNTFYTGHWQQFLPVVIR